MHDMWRSHGQGRTPAHGGGGGESTSQPLGEAVLVGHAHGAAGRDGRAHCADAVGADLQHARHVSCSCCELLHVQIEVEVEKRSCQQQTPRAQC